MLIDVTAIWEGFEAENAVQMKSGPGFLEKTICDKAFAATIMGLMSRLDAKSHTISHLA